MVLAGRALESGNEQGSGFVVVVDGGCDSAHVVPALVDPLRVDAMCEQPGSEAGGGGCGESPESLISDVPDPGTKRETGEVEQTED